MENSKDRNASDNKSTSRNTADNEKVRKKEHDDATENESYSGDQLIKKFAKPDSTKEIKDSAKEIVASDPDIDVEALDKAGEKFHKEKVRDNLKEAKNDAEFDQPET